MLVYLLDIPIISVQNSMGLHGKDAGIMIVQAITAIGLGYVGGKFFGMEGILMGLTIPTVIFTLIHKGVVISKVAFKISATKYLLTICGDILEGIVIIGVTILVCSSINIINPIISLILKGIVAVVVSVILIVIFSFRTEYFKETVQILKGIVKRGR